jgi:hypothetical protein
MPYSVWMETTPIVQKTEGFGYVSFYTKDAGFHWKLSNRTCHMLEITQEAWNSSRPQAEEVVQKQNENHENERKSYEHEEGRPVSC